MTYSPCGPVWAAAQKQTKQKTGVIFLQNEAKRESRTSKISVCLFSQISQRRLHSSNAVTMRKKTVKIYKTRINTRQEHGAFKVCAFTHLKMETTN